MTMIWYMQVILLLKLNNIEQNLLQLNSDIQTTLNLKYMFCAFS